MDNEVIFLWNNVSLEDMVEGERFELVRLVVLGKADEETVWNIRESVKSTINAYRQSGVVGGWFYFKAENKLVAVDLTSHISEKDKIKGRLKCECLKSTWKTVAADKNFTDEVLSLVPDIYIRFDGTLAKKMKELAHRKTDENLAQYSENIREKGAGYYYKKFIEDMKMEDFIMEKTEATKTETVNTTAEEQKQEDKIMEKKEATTATVDAAAAKAAKEQKKAEKMVMAPALKHIERMEKQGNVSEVYEDESAKTKEEDTLPIESTENEVEAQNESKQSIETSETSNERETETDDETVKNEEDFKESPETIGEEEKSQNVQDAAEEDAAEKSQNDELPTIQKSDKSVALCIHDKYALNMMPIYNSESLIVENCRFYLVDTKTKMPMIGSGEELKLSKQKIMGATDHSVMAAINKFLITFSEDELKQAFERAKIFLENVEELVAYSSSMTILEAYREVVEQAKKQAKAEEQAMVMDDDRKCKYQKESNEVWIQDSYMQELLDEIGTGFSKGVFGKKMSMLGGHYGVELLIRNKGRYTCNTEGNKRYYKIKIEEKLTGAEGEETQPDAEGEKTLPGTEGGVA